MSDSMNQPVTRGELREELNELRQERREEMRLLELRVDHKFDMWGGALLERIKSSEHALLERIKSSEQGLLERIGSSEQRVRADFARHVEAVREWIAAAGGPR